jgi:hypothetical protein
LVHLDEIKDLEELYTSVLKLEQGFNDPWQKAIKVNEENEEEVKRRKI